MPVTTKKIDKTYTLSSSNVNAYGFRLLTTGLALEKFARNPVGYYMHQRDGGIVVRWDNVRIEGDEVKAEPIINLANPRGQQTADEVEGGFLNGASFGQIVVLDWSDDPAMKLDGQTGITVTSWYPKEASLVDLPGNEDSLAPVLYDANENPINLADLGRTFSATTNKTINMKEIKLPLSADLIRHLNLSDNADAAAILKGINDLAAQAAQVPVLTAENGTLKTTVADLETKVADLEKAQTEKAVDDLLDNAQNQGKLTNEERAILKADYGTEPEKLKKLLDVKLAHPSVTQQIQDEKRNPKSVENLSWDELHRANKLAALKKDNYALYEQKFEEKYGSKPTK